MADARETNAKIDSLRAKVEADPKSRHFYPLAEELRRIGQNEEAERVLRAGLEHHSTYLSAWIGLGRLLKDDARYPESLDALMRGLALDPENVVAAKLLAHVYLAMGDKVEAIKKFKLVHAVMPTDEEAEEQIDVLDRELNPQNYAPVPPAATSPVDEPAHDSTEPPFPVDEAPASSERQAEPMSSPMQRISGADLARFDMTNPDPFAMGLPAPSPEAGREFEPELPDEVEPFGHAELPETAASTPAIEDPFEPVPDVPPEEQQPQIRRAPTSEDVWAEEDASGVLPESAATVTMAQILAQQGDVERARETYERVLERDPHNVDARIGLSALDEGVVGTGVSGGRAARLEAWRRKVAGS